MTYNYKTTSKIMNKVYFAISDQYGWKNVPYEHGNGKRTTKIEICGWRYKNKFIKKIFLENGLTTIDITKDDTIFLDAYDDYYGI